MTHFPHLNSKKTSHSISKFFKSVNNSPIVKELGRDAQAIASVPSTQIKAMNKITTSGAEAISSNMNILLYLGVGVAVVMVMNNMRR